MRTLLKSAMGLYLAFGIGCATAPKIWQGKDEEIFGTWKYEAYDLIFHKTTLVLHPNNRFSLSTSDKIVALAMQGKWDRRGFVLYLEPESTVVRGQPVPSSEIAAKYLVLPIVVEGGHPRIVINGKEQFRKQR